MYVCVLPQLGGGTRPASNSWCVCDGAADGAFCNVLTKGCSLCVVELAQQELQKQIAWGHLSCCVAGRQLVSALFGAVIDKVSALPFPSQGCSCAGKDRLHCQSSWCLTLMACIEDSSSASASCVLFELLAVPDQSWPDLHVLCWTCWQP